MSPIQVTQDADGRQARPAAFTILSVLLIAGEPLGLALSASGVLPRILDRGAWAVLLLATRLAIAAIAVAAGRALWHERPGAITLTRVALGFTAADVLLTSLSPVFPHNRPPGTSWPFVTAMLVYYAAWLAYLVREIVRAMRVTLAQIEGSRSARLCWGSVTRAWPTCAISPTLTPARGRRYEGSAHRSIHRRVRQRNEPCSYLLSFNGSYLSTVFRRCNGSTETAE